MDSDGDYQQPRRSIDAGSVSGSVHSTKQRHANDLVRSPSNSQRRRQPVSDTAPATSAMPGLPDESTIRATPALPRIKPFYAIVSDTTVHHASPNTYYPRVRYIFNDDDPDLLSSALATQKSSHERRPPDDHDPSITTSTRNSPENSLPDRAVLLDLVLKPDGKGYNVGSATSLSSDWAVVDSRLTRLGGDRPDVLAESVDDETLVLAVEGISVPVGSTSGSVSSTAAANREVAASLNDKKSRSPRAEGKQTQTEDYKALIGDFDKRMSLLRRVVQNSEQRQSHVSPADTSHDDDNLHQQETNLPVG